MKKSGALVYAQDATTEVLCLGWYIAGDNQPSLWRPGEEMPVRLCRHVEEGGQILAHNVMFERSIWDEIMVKQYGWPPVGETQWFDTIAACAYRGLPLKLDTVSRVLKLDNQKTKMPTKFYSPDKNGKYAEMTEEDYEYCRNDVASEVDLAVRLGPLPPTERRVFDLDQRINSRGVAIDMDYIMACQRVVTKATTPLVSEFRDLTSGLVPTQAVKFGQWVRDQGVDMPNMQKETIDAVLGQSEIDYDTEYLDEEEDGPREVPLPDHVRRALVIRRAVGSASVKKLAAFRNTVAADGRVHGLLQYHAGMTGRWGGRLLQPQNFPRPTDTFSKVKCEDLVNAIMSEDVELIESLWGANAIEAVASGLRHGIVAGPGKTLVVGDFSTVEARLILALAGQHDKVKYLADDGPIYELMGETIYGYKVTKDGQPVERQVGKNAVLGLGYEMGWPKFQSQVKKQAGMILDEGLCRRTVKAYREDFAPEVPKFWRALENAALRCVKTGRPQVAYGFEFAREEDFLTIRLHSGKKLWYYQPQLIMKPMKWDPRDVREGWAYWTQKQGRWVRVDAYGGMIAAHVTQASARELLVHAMFNCEDAGLPLVLTVHDENVAEVDDHLANPDLMEEMMTDIPQWAKNINVPIKAECWAGKRYRK